MKNNRIVNMHIQTLENALTLDKLDYAVYIIADELIVFTGSDLKIIASYIVDCLSYILFSIDFDTWDMVETQVNKALTAYDEYMRNM